MEANKLNRQSSPQYKTANRVLPVLAIVVWLFFMAQAGVRLAHPNLSYDSMIYLGLVASPSEANSEVVRARVRAENDRNLDNALSNIFTDPSPYRQAVLSQSALFERDLAYYQSKYGYVSAAKSIHAMGLSPFQSLELLSWSALAILTIVPLGLAARNRAWIALLILPAPWAAAQIGVISGTLLTDLLAASIAAILLVVWSFGRLPLVAIIAFLAGTIRPETFILLSPVLVIAILFRCERKRAAILFISALTAYLIGKIAFPGPGWWQQVAMVLYGPDRVVTGAPEFSIINFLRPAISNWLAMLGSAWFWTAAAIATIYTSLPPVQNTLDRRLNLLFWGVLLGTAARVFVFPIVEPRLFLQLIVSLSLATMIRVEMGGITERFLDNLNALKSRVRSLAKGQSL